MNANNKRIFMFIFETINPKGDLKKKTMVILKELRMCFIIIYDEFKIKVVK